ncbi:hypothetical protein [Novosphingobium sp.]|uniref:hypothetical protein n=1 Tax=Novosphingobium sp. TaxID=1874826 RepID=UPI0038BB03E3
MAISTASPAGAVAAATTTVRGAKAGQRNSSAINEIAIFALVAAAGAIASLAMPTIASYLAVALFLYATVIGYRCSPLATSLMLPIFVIRLLELFSSIVLNTGVSLEEIGTFSRPTSAFYWEALLYSSWPIATALLPSLNIRFDSLVLPKPMILRALLVGILIYGVVILAFYAVYGAPLFAALGKYAFYAEVDNRWLNILVRYRIAVLFIAGCIFVASKSIVDRLAIAVVFGAVFVFGADKITSPLVAISFFALPSFIFISPYILFRRQVVLLFSVALVAVLSVYFVSRFATSGSIDSTIDSVALRLPAQCQLWYVTTEFKPETLNLSGGQFGDEIKSMLPLGDTPDRVTGLGQSLAAQDMASTEAYIEFQKYNASFIMIMYPYVLHYYGIIPLLVFNFLLIAYYYWIARGVVFHLQRGHFLQAGLLALLYQAMVLALITGNLSTLLGTNIYLFLLVYGAITLFRGRLTRPAGTASAA